MLDRGNRSPLVKVGIDVVEMTARTVKLLCPVLNTRAMNRQRGSNAAQASSFSDLSALDGSNEALNGSRISQPNGDLRRALRMHRRFYMASRYRSASPALASPFVGGS